MVSVSSSHPPASFDDPVYVRTHFLGRVASEDLGVVQRKEWLKRRSSRHNDLCRWDANWFQPITAESFSSASSDSSDTDDDHSFDVTHVSSQSSIEHQRMLRSRSSTLPLSHQSRPSVEQPRARALSSIQQSPLLSDLSSYKRARTQSAPNAPLVPPKPLTIDTAQPLRLSSSNLSSLNIDTEAVRSLASSSRPSTSRIRIECSESDGSCHGDAGDIDPEAQLAAGIIQLRQQRKAVARSQSRTAGQRRRSAEASRAKKTSQPELAEDADSDDARSIIIRKHGNNVVLRMAEAMLDFGSSALERFTLLDGQEASQEVLPSLEALQPRQRASTTPKELAAEAEKLIRRRHQTRSARVSRSNSHASLTKLGALTKSWSVPKLLAFPNVLSPTASFKAFGLSPASLSQVTPSSTPIDAPRSEGFGEHSRCYSGYGLNTYADVPSAFSEINTFDAVGVRFNRDTLQHADSDLAIDASQVSPLWATTDKVEESGSHSFWSSIFSS